MNKTSHNLLVEGTCKTNNQSISLLQTRIKNIPWFTNVNSNEIDEVSTELIKTFIKELKLEAKEVIYAGHTELSEFSNLLTDVTKIAMEHRLNIQRKVNELGRSSFLEQIRDNLSEHTFHQVFDAAYKKFIELEDHEIRNICTSALMIVELSLSTEVVADAESNKNPFIYLIQVLERGHLPLGISEQKFIML